MSILLIAWYAFCVACEGAEPITGLGRAVMTAMRAELGTAESTVLEVQIFASLSMKGERTSGPSRLTSGP
jgi:hypothetical protein